MARFILVTLLVGEEQQQQAINIDAITRYMPVAADAEHPERSPIFLMGPAASEDRFECVHTFQELHDMINEVLGPGLSARDSS
jgi:hypothetical protein